jgi:hypothetical protein
MRYRATITLYRGGGVVHTFAEVLGKRKVVEAVRSLVLNQEEFTDHHILKTLNEGGVISDTCVPEKHPVWSVRFTRRPPKG